MVFEAVVVVVHPPILQHFVAGPRPRRWVVLPYTFVPRREILERGIIARQIPILCARKRDGPGLLDLITGMGSPSSQ